MMSFSFVRPGYYWMQMNDCYLEVILVAPTTNDATVLSVYRRDKLHRLAPIEAVAVYNWGPKVDANLWGAVVHAEPFSWRRS